MDEAPRERAISSEPCSGRPNPFDDRADHISRKRQRTSRGGSRSRSVEVESDSLPPGVSREDSQMPSSPSLLRGESSTGNKAETDLPVPSTPTRSPSQQLPPEPTSSRVTINLRTNRLLDTIPSSPPSPSPGTLSNMQTGLSDIAARASIESGSDALSTVPAETPTSSPSTGSPEIELVTVDDDNSEYGEREPQVAIINDDVSFLDPLASFPTFPYYADGELLTAPIHRLSRYLQYDSVDNDDVFIKLRDWIETFLQLNRRMESFSDIVYRNRDFFNALPEIFWALNYRSRFFGDFLQRSREGRESLSDLLYQLARLAGRLLAMDLRYITYYVQKGITDIEPELGSKPILHVFAWLLREEEGNHLGHNLEMHYGWKWSDDVAQMTTNFQTEGGTIPALTSLVQGYLRIVPRLPKLIDNLTDPCRLVSKIVLNASQFLEDSIGTRASLNERARTNIRYGYEFFRTMSVGLENIIEKHVTFLSPDAALGHLSSLHTILGIVLQFDSSLAQSFLEQQQCKSDMLTESQLPQALSLEWKLRKLKRLITSAQMQLRVTGVTTMCADLLSVYQKNKVIEASANPLLLYFAGFIIQNQLLDYLVGIGSHPEIISESSNILGFLIATKTYKEKETDMIWQTVMNSQDPRVVEAILRMVSKCLNLYEYRGLLYFCKKISDIPISSFSMAMREFCSNLFGHLVQKAPTEGHPWIDAPPFEICVRLIREGSVATSESPAGLIELQNFGTTRLRDLLGYGLSPDIRNAIYIDCIGEISSKSSTSAGSVCVLNALLRTPGVPQLMSTDLKTLTTEHALTELLVEELECIIQSYGDQPIPNSPTSSARRELLLAVILEAPDSIGTSLGDRLWNVLVGSQSKSFAARNISWQILNTALQRSHNAANSFLMSCFQDRLPKLPSRCFTKGALDFVNYAVGAWIKEVGKDSLAEDQTFGSPALEQLWHMILTAPANTIDAEAIKILVGVYVDSQVIISLSPLTARSVHLSLVDRCLRQLKGAASRLKSFNDGASTGSDEGMVIVASEDQFQEQEKIFARSLAVLREFLRAYQVKPQFATPKSRSPIAAATTDVEGEPLTLKYQSFDGTNQTEIKVLTLGKLNTAASLFASLQKATGFKNYKVYCGGKEVDPEVEICKSLEELNLNGLVLVRSREALDGQLTGKGSLELEITKHFDDLWSYLAMHEKVAQEIYYFLIKFPIYGQLVNEFESDISYATIFPSNEPFKSLYAVHCLRDYITTQSKQGILKEDSLSRAIQLLVAAVSDPEVLDQTGSDNLKDCLALHLLDCFIQLLKDSSLPSSISTLLDDTLLERLLQLLHDAMRGETSQNSVHLTWRSFEALLDVSSHSSGFWQSFGSYLNDKPLIRDLLLSDDRPAIRKSVVKHVTQKCSSSSSSSKVSATSFAMQFWPIVADLIPAATQRPGHCEETFSLALSLFKQLATSGPPVGFFDLNDLINQWGGLFLAHSCTEIVGNLESVDLVAHGLTNLLLSAAQRAKASRQALTCGSIGTDLFRRHLFPDLTEDNFGTGEIVPRIPLLHPLTRQALAETVYFLVKDDETQYLAVVESMSRLVPYAQGEEMPYSYEMSFGFERARSIRSQTGYVGLRNLSNTCYLNSLFTQLFMNIPFRDFMLRTHVSHGLTSQALLSETQTLFSHMQNQFKRYVDPAQLAGTIRTYEDTQIDVTVQMDVDEFYNLLFDRWEGQIISPDAKRKFRTFYGGQLVQQVKSKECPHISERLEPFSAIQCDIKGKTCLQESLQAYVDGEVMEGDNKYKCSQCDRHVDAVKRACLKDVPDNLIFHLKRFDFNLRTLQRNKINDHFSFPKTIDMKPYKVEHLMDSPTEIPEDIFELVGILVHAGTAESGHYYSFIRERPSSSDKETWVEFNDDAVTPWDPNVMEGACFGGPEYRGPLDTGIQYDKTWSAYMLFYQRSTSLTADSKILERTGMSIPVQLSVPTGLANQIALENEMLMRKYCLYDPSHATFVTKMLANAKQLSGGHCSAVHTVEKESLIVAAAHLDQVFARTKDIPDFPSFMMAIKQICHSCAECSRDYLEWFFDCPDALKSLLLRNPDMSVRNDIGNSILLALNKVKIEASYAYGLDSDGGSDDDPEETDPQLLQKMVKALNRLFEFFQTNIRAWPEYFGLVCSIAQLGKQEAALLLDAGFLRKAIEIVTADPLLPMNGQYQKMLSIISKRMASRPVAYDSVIGLLASLMEIGDGSLDPIDEDDERLELAMQGQDIPFTVTERHLIVQHWTRNQAHILVEKLLIIEQNPVATNQILRNLLRWPDPSLDQFILSAILQGIRQRLHTGSFLRAAVLYCQHSKHPKAFATIMVHTVKVASHNDADGKDFLQFFRDILDLEDDQLFLTKLEIYRFSLDQMQHWGPALLTDLDQSVRESTEVFVQELVLNNAPGIEFRNSGSLEQITSAEISMTAKKLGVACLDFLHERHMRQRHTAIRHNLASIWNVIEKIQQDFIDMEGSDELYNRRFVEQHKVVIPAIDKCAVEEIEEDLSDWDGSDDAYDDSSEPPMDRLGDLGGGDDVHV